MTPHESDALTLVNVAGIVGGIAAFVGLWRYVAGVFRRTVGRRRDAYRRLARLGTGAQLAFFTSVLGEPPAIRQTITREEDVPQEFGSGKVDVRYVESFYVDRDYFVQTITNEDQTVEAFSVTSRSRRFRPTMWLPVRVRLRDRLFRRLPRGWRPLMIVKLGRTRFVDAAPDWTPSSVRAWVGARAWRYTEAYYFGNPGNYQTYVLVHSNAGAGVAADLEALGEAAQLLAQTGGQWQEEDDPRPWSELWPVHVFRRSSAVNTVTVLGALRNEAWMPAGFGPSGDEVRTLP